MQIHTHTHTHTQNTRLPSHSAQVKETRRSLYDSESGVKKMAVEHHLGERSHTIERCHNLLSGERVERKDFVNLEEGGSEWVWNQGGDLSVETVNGDHREWGGCLCQETVSIYTTTVRFYSGTATVRGSARALLH